MRNLLVLTIILLINFSCNYPKKDSENFVLDYNSQKLQKTGEVLYSKFCIACHGSKAANDSFFVGNIKNDKYELSFLIDYINHQDSLLQHKNQLTIKIKEEYSNIDYLHRFNLTEQEVKAIVYYLKN